MHSPAELCTQYNGGFLFDIIMFKEKSERTVDPMHRGTHLNVMRRLTFFPLTGGCSEGLGAFIFFFKQLENR